MDWNDTEKDEEKKGGNTVNAMRLSTGDENEDSVETKEVGKADGMHFVVRSFCNILRLNSKITPDLLCLQTFS